MAEDRVLTWPVFAALRRGLRGDLESAACHAIAPGATAGDDISQANEPECKGTVKWPEASA